MANKNVCWTLQVEILTPVHVGTGRELFFERDYIVDENHHLLVVDQNALFEELASMKINDEELQSKINELVLKSNLNELVRISGRREGYSLKRFSDNIVFEEVSEIREQIKDGFFRPYLPGSSIKGAIRTALLAKMINDKGLEVIKSCLPGDSKKPSKGSADNRLISDLFSGGAREESNHDFLRILHVSDVILRNPRLVVTDVRWLNLIGENEVKWRPVGKDRKSVEKWEKATGIFIESISKETVGELTLQVDRFLFEEKQTQLKLQWEYVTQYFSSFEVFKNLLNQHAKKRLTKEMEFFNKVKNAEARKQCEQLIRNMEQESSEACYLQIGWGSGWRGMTGDWMDASTEEKMRELYKLGKNGATVFPKTRRLAVMNNQPCLPLGWIRILPKDYAPSPQKIWVDNEIQIIKAEFHFDHRQALFSKQLAERWTQLEDVSFKAQLLEEIKKRWQIFDRDVDWWEKPISNLSGAMKKAKKIYTER